MLVLTIPRVSSRVSDFPVASPCLWGKLQNFSLSKVSKQVVMPFCVAIAALCDIPTSLTTCRKSFCVAGAILLSRFHKMSCSLRGRCNTPHSIHSTLHPLHFTLYTLHIALYTVHFYTPQFTLYTLHSTLHPLLCTLLHSTTLRTLHFTRGKTRWSIKTSILCETSSNFHTV